MRKLKVLEVVKLNNGNNATILDSEAYTYKAEVTNLKGESQGIQHIRENDMKEILISNNVQINQINILLLFTF